MPFRDAQASSSPTIYQAKDFANLTRRRASSPLTSHFEATGDFPAERTSNPARFAAAVADKRVITSEYSAPCGPDRIQCTRTKPDAYSSVKEEGIGTAQSFLESIDNAASLRHGSRLESAGRASAAVCECCCRCGRTRSAKPGGARGRRSKSYTALRTGVSELSGWDWEPSKTPAPAVKSYQPGEAPLERLPMEVLDGIIAQLAPDAPRYGYASRNNDLISCLLTSRTIHVATINTVYNRITIPHSTSFLKFMRHMLEYPELGKLVRRLDLSLFTSIGLGRTRQMNAEIQNMTSTTLLKCLELTPVIQEVLLQEHLDDDIDEGVLQKLFFGLPKLRAVDLCGSSSTAFKNALSATVSTLAARSSAVLGIRRLGFHECFTVSTSTFEALMPRLPHLTHLDVAHTHITDKALWSIPHSASLTHLNLGRCTQISGGGVIDLLATHPAMARLVYLNLSCDIARYRLLWESDLDRLLPILPATLRSLNLSGAKTQASHIPSLLPLTKHLEELSVGFADLSMSDINSLVRPPLPGASPSPADPSWIPSTLHYLDLSGIPSITQGALVNSGCALLAPSTAPLEVLELSSNIISALHRCGNTNKRLGWVAKDLGRRGWYVREPEPGQQGRSRGRKSWKMGSLWWGMRKVPVAWGEVEGLYGHYMFKK